MLEQKHGRAEARHKGWTCTFVDNLEEPSLTCEIVAAGDVGIHDDDLPAAQCFEGTKPPRGASSTAGGCP